LTGVHPAARTVSSLRRTTTLLAASILGAAARSAVLDGAGTGDRALRLTM